MVEDKEAFLEALAEESVDVIGTRLDFKDPWGNRVQIVQYDQVQFTKADNVVKGMGISPQKTDAARQELKEKGLL